MTPQSCDTCVHRPVCRLARALRKTLLKKQTGNFRGPYGLGDATAEVLQVLAKHCKYYKAVKR